MTIVLRKFKFYQKLSKIHDIKMVKTTPLTPAVTYYQTLEDVAWPLMEEKKRKIF